MCTTMQLMCFSFAATVFVQPDSKTKAHLSLPCVSLKNFPTKKSENCISLFTGDPIQSRWPNQFSLRVYMAYHFCTHKCTRQWAIMKEGFYLEKDLRCAFMASRKLGPFTCQKILLCVTNSINWLLPCHTKHTVQYTGMVNYLTALTLFNPCINRCAKHSHKALSINMFLLLSELYFLFSFFLTRRQPSCYFSAIFSLIFQSFFFSMFSVGFYVSCSFSL